MKKPYSTQDWKDGWPPWHRFFFVKLFPSHRQILLLQFGNYLFRAFTYNLWGWKPRIWSYQSGTGVLCTVWAWAGLDVNYARKEDKK